MAKVPKGRYTREFKLHAVSMTKDEGLGIAETARRLSIFPKTIANWAKLAQKAAISQNRARPATLTRGEQPAA